ncbi:MAG TPA: UDP-glucose/GDP-mannose dehydrogenase family protein [Rhabdochlamydiaceae bacterium]|nr:UDP-glucose/GDP-mannose dehydrogenase family protein [Rhabdochlamydiaceae bacterium]
MKLLIVGTGYVGLVTGTCFAEAGHHVTCLDIDGEKIKQLTSGTIPFFEPGLQELVLKNRKEKRLFFTSNYAEAVKGAEVCFIAVSTPASPDGSCDLSYVYAAAHEIAHHMDRYLIIVNKSTVPVGTHAEVSQIIQKVLKKRDLSIPFDVVSNPEFLQEGCALKNSMHPDRIIIGSYSSKATSIMKELNQPFMTHDNQFFVMDPPSAELAKYAANAMLATRISFMNELACLCEASGANVEEIRASLCADKRIGGHYLYPGLGFGGSCLPKDILALKAMAKKFNVDSLLLNAVETINQNQKTILSQKIQRYFAGELKNKTIAIWGLSFKPDTDDLRQAPSLLLIEQLLGLGAKLRLFDPVSLKKAQHLLAHRSGLEFCKDEYEAAQGADAIALVTEWKQFRSVNLGKLRKLMQCPAFFDGRNQFSASEMLTNGFEYFGIGISKAR